MELEMKLINDHQLKLVHGAANLYSTELLSTEGLSQSCVKKLVEVLQPDYFNNNSEELIASQILSVCTFSEIDLLDERSESSTPIHVEYK